MAIMTITTDMEVVLGKENHGWETSLTEPAQLDKCGSLRISDHHT
jgi:hypothetical protein